MRSIIYLALASFLIASFVSASPFRNGTLPVKVIDKKVWIHLMPWFETRQSNNNGEWGIHWTMANKNPDNIIGEDGKREIAAHYYPEIGPYGSGDTATIDYQIQMMKLAGADGVLIDWPGTLQANDYPKNHQNCINFVNRLEGSGLEFAVVYEDRNLEFTGDKIGQAQNDMRWLQSNWMNKGNYIRIDGNPLLLVFGPIQLKSPDQWSQVFSVLNPGPNFLTLWYQVAEAGANARGEYSWIYSDFLTGLAHFYNFHQPGQKMGIVYPGFHDFYAEGGWGDSYFFIPHDGTNSFQQTLNLALQSSVPWIQIGTWNDYGEGTMVEPTREFGTQFLNILNSALGLPFGDREFNLVKDLYVKRTEYENGGGKDAARIAQFEAVNDALNNLEHDKAEKLMKAL